jgi:ribosomal protein S18 acetylase RimI-like enzyme/predicted nucleic acid-binding protein
VRHVPGAAFAATAVAGVTKRLSRPIEGDTTYRGVLALAKGARRTVGFLTDSAFAQRARQGTLVAALKGNDVAGYILYDLPRDEIRIVHLVVASGHQRQGIARELVDTVAKDHSERRGIVLHCRNDFPANDLWHKLDFVPLGERPGRSFEGKLLTRWFRSFGQPDLFTFLHEADSRPVATMDACTFIDLIAQQPKAVADQLRADWLGEHVRLAVTDHLLVELHKGQHAPERRRQTAAAEAYRLPSMHAMAWKSVYSKLLEAHPDAPAKDHDDLTYAAQAIAAQAAWLITNDKPFVRRYAATAAELGGLRLVSPSAFLREVDEQARGDRYRPIDLAGTAVTRQEVNASALSRLDKVFVNHQAGERIRDLRETIELAAACTSTVRLEVIEVDGSPRGLVCWRIGQTALEVLLVRATAGRGETTIGRHLLGLIRDQAVASGSETIRILDPHPSPSVQRSFRDEGFAALSDDVVTAHALTGTGTLSQLREKAAAIGSPLADSELPAGQADDLAVHAAAAERWFAPFRVLNAGIPTFVVPIKHGWATALLDAGLAQEQLLPREWGLGLRRELVYYRSPRNPGGLAAPGRLLWYVSGSEPGAGMIRATSHLTEVAVDEHKRLFHRFQPLGIYTLQDVAKCADGRGRAMALRFSHTECFEHPIPLDEYRALVSGDPKSRQVVLRSARSISEHVFVSILRLGRTGHRE